jgi:hypothetical protein
MITWRGTPTPRAAAETLLQMRAGPPPGTLYCSTGALVGSLTATAAALSVAAAVDAVAGGSGRPRTAVLPLPSAPTAGTGCCVSGKK